MIERGSIYWADLGPVRGSAPAKRRPVLVIQSHHHNASRLSTTIVATITSNTSLAPLPGNVFLPAAMSGLPRDSAVNATALATLDKKELVQQVGRVPDHLMEEVDAGLRRVLGL